MTKNILTLSVVIFGLMLSGWVPVLAQDAPEKSGNEPNTNSKSASEKSPKEQTSEKNRTETSSGYNSVNFPEAAGPVELRPGQGTRITLQLTDSSIKIYEAIARQGKINVLFDPDYIPRNVSIDLKGVSLQDALKIAAFQTRTFWRPVTSDTIFVTLDTPPKRREFEQQLVKTFYFPNVWSPTDLQDIVNGLRTIIEVQRVQQMPAFQTITVRTTPEQMAIVEKLIEDLTRSKQKTGGQYRLEYKVTESGEGAKPAARTYNLLLEPHQIGKLRLGPRIPIQGLDKDKAVYTSYYMDAGKDIDSEIRQETEHTVNLRLTLEFFEPSIDDHGTPQSLHGDPILQQTKIETSVTLELGTPTVVSSFQDPVNKHIFQIEATAVRTKTKE